MAYQSIFFVQGDDARELLAQLDRDGQFELIEELADFFEMTEPIGDETANPVSGDDDCTLEEDGYRLTWNTRLGYIGLERVLPAAIHPCDEMSPELAAAYYARATADDDE